MGNKIESRTKQCDKQRIEKSLGKYSGNDFKALLAQHEFIGSMSRKGDCWDNAVAESFFIRLRLNLFEEKPFAPERKLSRLFLNILKFTIIANERTQRWVTRALLITKNRRYYIKSTKEGKVNLSYRGFVFRKTKNKLINLSQLIQIRRHSFYDRCIDQNSLVVDLGANKGDFSLQISHAFGCKCYALEASPSLYNVIPKNQYIKKFNLAVCKRNGPIPFYLSSNLEASTIIDDVKKAWGSIGTITVEGTTLEDFLIRNKISSIDLLKIDIEGAEIEVLDSTSDNTLRTIKQITIEFHQFCKGFNCREDIIRIKKRLNNLGFICIVFSQNNADVLFINVHKVNFKWWERFYVKLLIYLFAIRSDSAFV